LFRDVVDILRWKQSRISNPQKFFFGTPVGDWPDLELSFEKRPVKKKMKELVVVAVVLYDLLAVLMFQIIVTCAEALRYCSTSVVICWWILNSCSSSPAVATCSDHMSSPAAAAAPRLVSWHPPVSTGHSFSPPSLAHSLIQQRVASGRYRPLPGMVRGSVQLSNDIGRFQCCNKYSFPSI